MFSFHRPKVYRSSTGCCICKAKSSSSRFTDSKKYEDDFVECFQLDIPRKGEICNACVLLVKRWKKLPPGSDRNWRHVVDARAGPGIKSMTKVKSRNKKVIEINEKGLKKKSFEHESSPTPSDKSDLAADSEVIDDFYSENGPNGSRISSLNASPTVSDSEDNIGPRRRYKSVPKRRDNFTESEFIDLKYWKPEKHCCGVVYIGKNRELLLDARLWKPCKARLANCENTFVSKSKASTTDSTLISKNYSDNSSDSGYDESSNPSIAFNSVFCKKKSEKEYVSNLPTELHHNAGN